MGQCTNCGYENWTYAKFCENCGNSLDSNELLVESNTKEYLVESSVNEPLVESHLEIPVVKTNVIKSMIKANASDSLVEDSVGGSLVEDDSGNSLVVADSLVEDGVGGSLVEDDSGNSLVVADVDDSLLEDNVEKLHITEAKQDKTSISRINDSPSAEINVNQVETYNKNPIIALVLSLLFICLGQFYNGQILKGIIFVLVIFVLFNIFYPIGIILGFIMIIYSAIDAYLNAKAITKNNGNYFYTTIEGSV